jgi:hypothetical protein
LDLERLFLAMLPRIDLPRALLRGRSMKAAATMNGCLSIPNADVAAEALGRNQEES